MNAVDTASSVALLIDCYRIAIRFCYPASGGSFSLSNSHAGKNGTRAPLAANDAARIVRVRRADVAAGEAGRNRSTASDRRIEPNCSQLGRISRCAGRGSAQQRRRSARHHRSAPSGSSASANSSPASSPRGSGRSASATRASTAHDFFPRGAWQGRPDPSSTRG